CVRGARLHPAIGKATGDIEEEVWSDKIAKAATHGPEPIEVRRDRIDAASGDRRIGKGSLQGFCRGGAGNAFGEKRCSGETLRRSTGITGGAVTRNSGALDVGFEAEND